MTKFYCIILVILFAISVINFCNILLSYQSLKVKMFKQRSRIDDSFNYKFKCCDSMKSLSPIVTHFADIASNIGVLIEFYAKSNINDNNGINHQMLFYATLGALIFYRIITSISIFIFTKSYFDALLQLVDLYIYKFYVSVLKNMSKTRQLLRIHAN